MSKLKVFNSLGAVIGLAWGLHGPFREYLARMPDGTMTALGDAELLVNDEAYFPIDRHSSTADSLHFTGTLQFTGHNGMLAVTIQDPWLKRTEGTVTLTIVDPFDCSARMDLVAAEFQDDNTAKTRLAEAGTDVFMGNYPENIAFDPLRILWAGKD